MGKQDWLKEHIDRMLVPADIRREMDEEIAFAAEAEREGLAELWRNKTGLPFPKTGWDYLRIREKLNHDEAMAEAARMGRWMTNRELVFFAMDRIKAT